VIDTLYEDPESVADASTCVHHRKLSSDMRSESNRTISVANAQRPSRDTVIRDGQRIAFDAAVAGNSD
jgi:hypothetical protein